MLFYDSFDGYRKLSNVSTLYNVISLILLLLELLYRGFEESDHCEFIYAR